MESGHSSLALSSASSTLLKADSERATLLAKASTLKRKHNLEEREAQLKREKENFEIQTALAASDDKIQILDEFEGFRISSRASSRNGMDSYVGLKHSSHTDRQAAQGKDIQPNVQRTASATAQPQPQALETLQSYQMLTNQHRLALLHPQSTPVFKGDPLECLLFIRAFEPGVENKRQRQRGAKIGSILLSSILRDSRGSWYGVVSIWNLNVANVKLRDFWKNTLEKPTSFQWHISSSSFFVIVAIKIP